MHRWNQQGQQIWEQHLKYWWVSLKKITSLEILHILKKNPKHPLITTPRLDETSKDNKPASNTSNIVEYLSNKQILRKEIFLILKKFLSTHWSQHHALIKPARTMTMKATAQILVSISRRKISDTGSFTNFEKKTLSLITTPRVD